MWHIDKKHKDSNVKQLASQLKIKKDEFYEENLKRMLRTQGQNVRILFVLDGFDDQEEVKNIIIKSSNISYLITSRNKNWEKKT
jgi:hypothetical protein